MRYLFAVSVVVAGCSFPGAPVPGEACGRPEVTLDAECVDLRTVAYCEGAKWKLFDCPSECRSQQQVKCDWTRAADQSPCPAHLQNWFVCGGSKKMLLCRDGKWQTLTCSSGSCGEAAYSTPQPYTSEPGCQ